MRPVTAVDGACAELTPGVYYKFSIAPFKNDHREMQATVVTTNYQALYPERYGGQQYYYPSIYYPNQAPVELQPYDYQGQTEANLQAYRDAANSRERWYPGKTVVDVVNGTVRGTVNTVVGGWRYVRGEWRFQNERLRGRVRGPYNRPDTNLEWVPVLGRVINLNEG